MADTELMQLEKIGSGNRNPVQETRYNELRSAAPAVGGGTDSYDSLSKSLPNVTDFAKTLNAGENDVFSSYAAKSAAMPKPLDLYNTLESAAGIPQLKNTQSTLQGQIYDLEDTLRRIEPDVSARSGQSIVTEAQRRGMVTATKEPILDKLGWVGQSLGRVSDAISGEKADISNKVGLAMEGFKQELEPYKEKLSLTIDQNSRMMTGFTADRQSQLDILLAKIKRQEQLTDQETEAAGNLALEEQKFEQQKQMMQMEYNQPDNKIVDSNGRQLLVDMKTGRKIADLGSSKTGASGFVPYPITPSTPTTPKPTQKPTMSTNQPQYSAPVGTVSGNWYSIGGSWVPMVD